MDSKFNYKGIVFDKIGNITLNDRLYLFMVSDIDVEYIRVDNNGGNITYVAPSKKFSLQENAGKSLVQLNERILMNHIALKLKDIKKDNDIEMVKQELTRIQTIIEQNGFAERVKKRLSGITEEAHQENVKDMLQSFDKIVYKKIKEEVKLPEGDLGNTTIIEPVSISKQDLEDLKKYVSESKKEDPLDNKVETTKEEKNETKDNQSVDVDMAPFETDHESVKDEPINDGPSMEKAKVLVKKKNAAFADVIIFCLAVQLVLFVGLIFVMLLIK